MHFIYHNKCNSLNLNNVLYFRTVNSMDMDYPDDDLASYLSPVSNPDFVPNSDFVANPEYQGNGDFATNEFNLAYLS